MYFFRRNNLLIGTSRLELGDPSMAVAFGEFTSACDLEKVLGTPSHTEKALKGWEGFSVSTKVGTSVECDGVYLVQVEIEHGEYEYEITCLGISHPLYGTLFPDRARACDKQYQSE